MSKFPSLDEQFPDDIDFLPAFHFDALLASCSHKKVIRIGQGQGVAAFIRLEEVIEPLAIQILLEPFLVALDDLADLLQPVRF